MVIFELSFTAVQSPIDEIDVHLVGPTGSNPDSFESIELSYGGGNSITVFAVFEEIGTISLSMQQFGSRTTTIDGQTLGHNGSVTVESGSDLTITAQHDPRFGYTGYRCQPGVATLSSNRTPGARILFLILDHKRTQPYHQQSVQSANHPVSTPARPHPVSGYPYRGF